MFYLGLKPKTLHKHRTVRCFLGPMQYFQALLLFQDAFLRTYGLGFSFFRVLFISQIACHNLGISMFFMYFSSTYKLYCVVRFTVLLYKYDFYFSVDEVHIIDEDNKAQTIDGMIRYK